MQEDMCQSLAHVAGNASDKDRAFHTQNLSRLAGSNSFSWFPRAVSGNRRSVVKYVSIRESDFKYAKGAKICVIFVL